MHRCTRCFSLGAVALFVAFGCSKSNQVDASQHTECGDDSLDCVPCTAGEQRCDGAVLKVCQPDGQGFDVVEMCVTEALCVEGLPVGVCAPPVCTSAETRCDGARMIRCSAGRNVLEETDCPSEASCVAGLENGQCAAGECSGPTQCSGVDTECRKRSCNAGVCGFEDIAVNVLVSSQTDGDCVAVVCDGQGGTVTVADNDDIPEDGNACTEESCENGVPTTAFSSYGESCDGDGVCDGKGLCVPLSSACAGIDLVGAAPMQFVTVPAPDGSTYSIDQTEVTRGQYCGWLMTQPSTDGQPLPCVSNTDFSPGCSCTGQSCDQQPQNCVDWCDAYAYCKAQGKRLCGQIGGGPASPAGANDAASSQWFNACSAGGTQDYTNGSTCDPQACNVADHGVGDTMPVESLPSCHSPEYAFYAVSDLTGNVAEWVDNCEVGLDECRIRGGSFQETCGADTRCAAPSRAQRFGKGENLGFRCCSDP